jgi:hypothetical protein
VKREIFNASLMEERVWWRSGGGERGENLEKLNKREKESEEEEEVR